MSDAQILVRPVTEVNLQEFVQALNAAYADYYVPIYLTPQSFQDLVTRESIRLDASQAALHDGDVVGTGLLGVREAHGWVGGVGVLPDFRQQGIARRLMRDLIEAGCRIGLETVQLEVITRNKPAIALYQSLRFETLRELLVLVCNHSSTTLKPERIAPDVTIDSEPAARLLPALGSLPAARRPWQREIAAQEIMLPKLKALAARKPDGSIAGVCTYRGDSVRQEIVDLAAATSRVGRALAVHLMRQSPGTSFSYLNVAEDDPLLSDLLQVGFQRSLSQLEMILPLNRKTQPA